MPRPSSVRRANCAWARAYPWPADFFSHSIICGTLASVPRPWPSISARLNCAIGKPVYAYSNVATPFYDRVETFFENYSGRDAQEAMLRENFGLFDNLMNRIRHGGTVPDRALVGNAQIHPLAS